MRIAGRPAQKSRLGAVSLKSMTSLSRRIGRPGIGMDRDLGWHRVGEPQLINCSHSVGKKSSLLPACDRINDCVVVGGARFAGQRVDARKIVESAIDAPEIARKGEALKGFIDGGSWAEIEEVVRGPDEDGFVAANAVEDRPPEIEIRATSRRCCLSDLCRHISDRSSVLPVRRTYTLLGQIHG